MTNPCNLFISQHKKAKETLEILLKQKEEIEIKLKVNPISAVFHKDLRMIDLDIKITKNEIEQAEHNIQECESKNNSSKLAE